MDSVTGIFISRSDLVKKKILIILSLVWCAFQLFIVINPETVHLMSQRVIHLTFALVFLWIVKDQMFVNRIMLNRILTGILIAVTLAICYYLVMNADRFDFRPYGETALDSIVAVTGLILVLEATRRVMGWALVIVAAVFMLYAVFGYLVPGPLQHRGVDFIYISEQLFFTLQGVFGQVLGISASLIFIYLLFGGFLLALGGGDFFTKLAYATVGHTRGGAAKVAVVASAFFGSISGSAISNVVTTGTITIPMMKKLGFKREFSGAVEAVASTGGQILPPVMGATAFVMADMMGVSYGSIVLAAAIPAVLYFVAVLFMVDFEAAKMGIQGIEKKELPSIKQVLKEGWHFLIPFIVLIYLLLFLRWEAQTAGLWAIISMVLVQIIKEPRLASGKKIVNSITEGTKSAITVAIPCAAIGIIVGIVLMTGLGLSFTGIVSSLAGNNIFPLLLMMMIGSLIIGMGVPTTAAYVMLAVLMVPTIIGLGVPPIAAHMFALYFGILSVVTPPVALAAYTAAGIAESNPFKTGVIAFKLALSGFIIPFVFVYQPGLLLEDTIINIMIVTITTLMGIVALSASIQNYYFGPINIAMRLLLFVNSVFLIFPGFVFISISAFIILTVFQIVNFRRKKMKTQDLSNNLT